MKTFSGFGVRYRVCVYRKGKLFFVEDFTNLMPYEGLNKSLESIWNGEVIGTKYISLKSAGAASLEDTDAKRVLGQTAWTELTQYSESTRPEVLITEDPVEGVLEAAPATFTLNATIELAGVFVALSELKGVLQGSSTLMSVADFPGGTRTMQAGDVVVVVPSFVATST